MERTRSVRERKEKRWRWMGENADIVCTGAVASAYTHARTHAHTHTHTHTHLMVYALTKLGVEPEGGGGKCGLAAADDDAVTTFSCCQCALVTCP